jgi:heat shock protein HtpX
LHLLGAIGGGVFHTQGTMGTTGGSRVHLTVVPFADQMALPCISAFGPSLVEVHLASGAPGTALRCRIEANGDNLRHLQRRLNQAFNGQRSRQVIAGMVLLLALCGWIVDGDDGALGAVIKAMPSDDAITPDTLRSQFGAVPLQPGEMPALFDILREICRRVGLWPMPDLYYLPSPGNMNAYAIGGERRSAIILAEGLLRGMTPSEIAGILAHEVAHIRNNDAWALTWAAALCRAITQTALSGLRDPRHRPVAMLLAGAPMIAQLLWLSLSRIRELDADAAALEATDNPRALVAALDKLERHHTGAEVSARSEGMSRFLRSHPATWERVDLLLKLAA